MLHFLLVHTHHAGGRPNRIALWPVLGKSCLLPLLDQGRDHLYLVHWRCLGMALADGLVGSLLLLLVAEAPALVRVLLHLLILALAVSIGLQYLLTAGNHDGIDVVCVVIKAQFLVVIIKRLLHRGWLSLASSIRAVFRVESRVPFLGKSRGICHILLL